MTERDPKDVQDRIFREIDADQARYRHDGYVVSDRDDVYAILEQQDDFFDLYKAHLQGPKYPESYDSALFIYANANVVVWPPEEMRDAVAAHNRERDARMRAFVAERGAPHV